MWPAFSFSTLFTILVKEQAPVVQKLGKAIHRMNLYSIDKYQGNPLLYPVDSDLHGG